MVRPGWGRSAPRDIAADDLCRVCAAVRRAEHTPQLDAVVALGIAAEVELDDMDPRFVRQVVSSFIRLDEEDALALMRHVPAELCTGSDRGDSCPFLGNCDFRGLLLHYLVLPRSVDFATATDHYD